MYFVQYNPLKEKLRERSLGDREVMPDMERYGNLSGGSGIVAYESGPDFIRVQFSSGSVYLYTYESAGPENIELMKELASKGEGLNSFINMAVRSNYARRER